MAKIEANLVEAVVGTKISSDGLATVVKLNMGGGEDLILALPINEVMRLIDALCASLADSTKIQGGKNRLVANASWFEVGQDAETQDIVLTMTFGAGGQFAFVLPGGMPKAIFESLGVATGASIPPTPPEKPN